MSRRLADAGLLTALLFAAGACGGGHATSTPTDDALVLAQQSGRQAMDLHRPTQAVTQYQRAMTLALARNDAAAIGDSGYNLATAQLDADTPQAALDTARQTQAALAARASPSFAELDLVQAAALYRLCRDAEADEYAAWAQAEATADAATRERASYVRGLLADRAGDPARLRAALAELGTPKHPDTEWTVQHDQLAARLALAEGDGARAASLALDAAAILRTSLRYREMAGALGTAARGRQMAGQSGEAGRLYLQAGQSAAARQDWGPAQRWLTLAADQGDIADRQTAGRALSRARTALRQSASAALGSSRASGLCVSAQRVGL